MKDKTTEHREDVGNIEIWWWVPVADDPESPHQAYNEVGLEIVNNYPLRLRCQDCGEEWLPPVKEWFIPASAPKLPAGVQLGLSPGWWRCQKGCVAQKSRERFGSFFSQEEG